MPKKIVITVSDEVYNHLLEEQFKKRCKKEKRSVLNDIASDLFDQLVGKLLKLLKERAEKIL